MIKFVASKTPDPEYFWERMKSISMNPMLEATEKLHFSNGRIFDAISRPMRIDEKTTYRVWSIRDITTQVANEKQKQRTILQMKL